MFGCFIEGILYFRGSMFVFYVLGQDLTKLQRGKGLPLYLNLYNVEKVDYA